MSGSQDFPCSIELRVPFPTERLASTALKSLSVDPELSPLVRRALTVLPFLDEAAPVTDAHVLKVNYEATTNRMLRVAVNSFMDSLRLVVEVMENLDSDVLSHPSNIQPASLST